MRAESPKGAKIRLIVAFVAMLFIGVVYAWSILSAPLAAEFGWNSRQMGLNFTLTMTMFCLGGMIGSRLTARTNPRFTLSLGAVLILAGYLLTVLLQAQRLMLLYFAYGGLIGTGVGMAYNAILNVLGSWFPHNRGEANGIALMGFGTSTLLLGSGADALISGAGCPWRLVFALMGGSIFLVLLLCRRHMTFPGPEVFGQADHSQPEDSLSPGKMLRSGFFWVMFMTGLLASAIGTGIVGHAKYVVAEAGNTMGAATLTVGVQSFCNGLGRQFFGRLYDKKGRAKAMWLDAGIFIAALMGALLSLCGRISWLMVLSIVVLGFAYGGMPTFSTAFIGEYFGGKYYADNISIMNIHILIASFASTLSGSLQTSSGSYRLSLLVFMGCAVLVIGLNALLCSLERKIKKS